MCVSASPDAELIELVRREGSPLGIHIRSSRTRPGIFVYHLVPGSIAKESGLIQVGDRLLEVNGCDIRYASVDDAVAVMSVCSITICKTNYIICNYIIITSYANLYCVFIAMATFPSITASEW